MCSLQDILVEDPENKGAVFCPIILGSDKTTVSVATGQNEYYPLYISNGLIHNNICQAHQNGVALVTFLAIPKSKFIILCVHHFCCWLAMTSKRTGSIMIVMNFANFNKKFSMTCSSLSSALWTHGCQNQRSSGMQMVTFAEQSMAWVHI